MIIASHSQISQQCLLFSSMYTLAPPLFNNLLVHSFAPDSDSSGIIVFPEAGASRGALKGHGSKSKAITGLFQDTPHLNTTDVSRIVTLCDTSLRRGRAPLSLPFLFSQTLCSTIHLLESMSHKKRVSISYKIVRSSNRGKT
jgi:hypothetical protein